MFKVESLNDIIPLRPNQIGSNIYDRVVDSLKDKIEHKILGKIDAYVISIVNIDDSSLINGTIDEVTSSINYNVAYDAVVFRPIKGEMIDVKVDYCSDPGIWGYVCYIEDINIQCFLPRKYMKPCSFDEKTETFLIDGEKICKDSTVTLKIVESKIDSNSIEILCSMI